jgi:ATPase subunit of ABC transporter with duplicated ATPase domains
LRIHLAELQLPYGQQEPLSLTVHAGEHWHISGDNGSGKSTLLKVLAGLETPRSGTCEVHGNCLYLDQNFSFLDPALSAIENLLHLHPERTESGLRTELAGLRLPGDKALIPVAALSGGERLKVALIATLTESETRQPDILLLDEPDNHLDLDSRRLLEQTLADYSGTLLVVSHDRAFVAALSPEHQLRLTSGKVAPE